MTVPPELLDRREALRRAALLLGGVLSAPTLATILAGCETRDAASGASPALHPDQQALIAAIAERIIPETDTPGAVAAGVPTFIETMLAEYYAADRRARFLAGLADVDTRARRERSRRFVDCAPAEQHALLAALDREAFRPAAPPEPFFRMMKELTLLGYYTSQPGATRELRYAPVPGRYDGCVPLTRLGRAWAV